MLPSNSEFTHIFADAGCTKTLCTSYSLADASQSSGAVRNAALIVQFTLEQTLKQ